MRTKEEKLAGEAKMKELGLSFCAGGHMNQAFGVTDEWKNEIEESVMGMTDEFQRGLVTPSEYIVSMISLGSTENQRLYLSHKATQFMEDFKNEGPDSVSLINLLESLSR